MGTHQGWAYIAVILDLFSRAVVGWALGDSLDTSLPLSVAYLDEDGHIVSTADMAPCGDSERCPKYPSRGLANLVIEVPQGTLADLGIVEGSTTRVTGRCAPTRSSG